MELMRNVVWQCPELEIIAKGSACYSGVIHRKDESTGVASQYAIRGFSGWSFPIVDVHWDSADEVLRQVRADDVSDLSIPGSLSRLGNGGLKLDVRAGPEGTLTLDLRQAKPKADDPSWFTLQNASESELEEGAGIDAIATLRGMGARIGSRRELLADRSSHKNSLCAVFAEAEGHIPVVAYALTRVLPLLRSCKG